MSPAAKRVAFDAVGGLLDALDEPQVPQQWRGRPKKATATKPTLKTRPIVGRALCEAVDRVIDAINEGRRALGERGAPPVAAEVRQAWHQAAHLILDALGEHGAVLQKQRRMRPNPPLPVPSESKLTPEQLAALHKKMKKRGLL